MATPDQIRTIDPYSSYDSRNANRMLRIISDGINCLLYPTPIDVEENALRKVLVKKGKAIQDDMLIDIINDLEIDMRTSDNYISAGLSHWDEAGYYYIVLSYSWAQTNPPPMAEIKIIKPSQRATLYDPKFHLFIKCIEVTWDDYPAGSPRVINVLDEDPENTSVKRVIHGFGDPAVKDAVNKRHDEDHTITSHTDTSVTGAQLNNLQANVHDEDHTIASHTDTSATGSNLDTLTDGSNADSLHEHTKLNPVGSIIMWPRNGSLPTGYITCEGQNVSRITYSELFAKLGDIYGGNGETTFGIPDFRGEFVRGWSHGTSRDPDKSARTSRGDGVGGDNVGTRQTNMYSKHRHEGQTGGGNNPYYSLKSGQKQGFGGGSADDWWRRYNGSYAGGNETRPRNIYMQFIIKYI